MGYCIDSIYSGHALCVHNPSTGREATMPHAITRAGGPLKKFIVIGAGPGGLEAARVAGARGHKVVLFEAADEPGGQVRVAAGLARRREILGIIDWRVAQCAKYDVSLRTNVYAEAADVVAENPDVVIVATGGVPNLGFLDSGEELATSSWDVLTGSAKPEGSVIVYDDNGAHPGVSVAEFAARAGAKVEFVTPERALAPDVGSTSFPPYLRAFSEHGVTITLNLRLESLRQEGNGLVAVFLDEYGAKRVEKRAEKVIVEHGAIPADELYFALRPGSRNLGEVDYPSLVASKPQAVERNPHGTYDLYRIGDAVASRNIHAAVYDALRLVRVM
jgi:NADPH-dependent 2,4-dienoyl-CoA reductase/sulfur reductase-like enzyme